MDGPPEDPRDVRRRLQRTSIAIAGVTGIAILVFTLSPGDAATSGATVIDRIAEVWGTPEQASWLLHAVLFGLLGASLTLWFASSSAVRAAPVRTLAMLILALWVFAAATELAQGAVDGRQPALGDWVADMFGALLGLLAAPLVMRPLISRLLR